MWFAIRRNEQQNLRRSLSQLFSASPKSVHDWLLLQLRGEAYVALAGAFANSRARLQVSCVWRKVFDVKRQNIVVAIDV